MIKLAFDFLLEKTEARIHKFKYREESGADVQTEPSARIAWNIAHL